MNEVAGQLKKLITISRKINDQLNRKEINIASLERKFDERAEYIERLIQLTPKVDPSSLTKEQSDSLRLLFNQFDEQSQNIQKALDDIMEKSKGRLDEAIKHSKAEKSYQLLKRR